MTLLTLDPEAELSEVFAFFLDRCTEAERRTYRLAYDLDPATFDLPDWLFDDFYIPPGLMTAAERARQGRYDMTG